MKTDETTSIENALFNYCYDLNQYAVEEVSMPRNFGIVDMLSVQYLGSQDKGFKKIWRFFEIKITKADFFSKAVHSFHGHYNYYVLPEKLFDQVHESISSEIGVIISDKYFNLNLIKKPRRKQLDIQEEFLDRAILNSMAREVKKAKLVEKGLKIYNTEVLAREMVRRHPYNSESPLADMYEDMFLKDSKKFIQLLTENATSENQKDLIMSIFEKRYHYFKNEVVYLTEEIEELREQKRVLRSELRSIKLKLQNEKLDLY